MRKLSLLTLLLFPLSAGPACVAPEDGDFFSASSDKQDNVSGSRWHVPPGVLSIGDEQEVGYAGAGPWTGSCGDGLSEGAQALTEYLEAKYPRITSIGGFSCRHIVGNPSKASVHSTGRALDIMLPVGFRSEADNPVGDPIGNFLIANAEDMGIQFIIWDRTSWAPHRDEGRKERYYSGAHPHNDHLHVELSPESAAGLVPWRDENWQPVEPEMAPPPAPTEPEPTGEPDPTPLDELPEEPSEDPPDAPAPSVPPLGEQEPEEPEPTGPCAPLPPEGGIIDDQSGCLWLRGPANYWRHENQGHEGSLSWTEAVQSGKHLTSAEYQIVLEEAGSYEIEVYVVPEYGNLHAARYYISHGPTTSEAIIDMSAGEWVSLGSYAFAEGGNQKLTLFDNSDVQINEGARIVVDAIRLIGETPEAPNDDPPNETPGDDSEEPPSDSETDPFPGEESEPEQEANEEGAQLSGGCQAGGRNDSRPVALLFLLALFAGMRRRHSEA